MARIILTLLIIASFYILRLDSVITYDEVYTAYVYATNPLVALLQYTLPNNHQLHSFMVWLSTTLLGDSIIAIRLPALFASMLTLSMIYRLAKRLYSENVAWLCVILLAIHPLFFQYSLLSRGYILSALLFIILIYHIKFGRLWTRSSTYVVITLCCALLITLPTMIIAIFGCLLWGVTFHNFRLYRRFVLIPAIVGCIAGAMFYVQPLMTGAFSQFSAMFGYDSLSLFMTAFMSEYVGASLIAMVMLVLLVIAILNYRKQAKPLTHLALILLGITIAVLIVQVTVTGTTIFPRNLFFILPLFILLIGNISQLWSHKSLVYAVAIALLIIGGFSLISTEPSITDNLISAIEANAEDSDYLVFGCCQDGPMRYELEKRESLHLIDPNKDYDRIVIFEFSTSFDEMITRYNLPANYVTACIREQWNNFTPYVCRLP